MVRRSKQLESSQAERSQRLQEAESELTACQLRVSQVNPDAVSMVTEELSFVVTVSSPLMEKWI